MVVVYVILTSVLLLLTAIFLLRSKITWALSLLLRLAFPFLLLLALSVIFLPSIYKWIADFSLKQAGTLQSIQNFDDRLMPILEAPENLVEDLQDLFNIGDEDQDEDTVEEGLLEEELYPQLVNTISIIFRVVVIAISIVGMVGIIYVSYSIEGVAEVERLKMKLASLEHRLADLESG